MKQIIIFSIASLVAHCLLAQGNLYVGSGATLYTNGASTLTLDNASLTNNGTVLANDGTVVIKGNALKTNSTIQGNICQLKHLTIDKSANDAQLDAEMQISGNLTLSNGKLDIQGHTVDLQTTGSVQNESNTNYIYSSNNLGGIVFETTLNAPNAANPANLGLEITSSQNLGTVQMTRFFSEESDGLSAYSILRSYQIGSANNTNLNATIKIKYFDNELNGRNENTLQMWTDATGSGFWQAEPSSINNVAGNYVQLSGVNTMNHFSIGDPMAAIQTTLITPPSHYCAGSMVDVSYTTSGITFNTGNTFILQLSDASGSFATPVVLKTITSSATSGTISGMIPWQQTAGLGYRVRVVSSNTAFTGADNGAGLEIKTSTASSNITFTGGILANPTATGGTNKLITGCQGTNIVLTANVSNSTSYAWLNNGVQVGASNTPTLTVNSSWGDYQLVAYDINGCGSAADTVGINLKPTPIANGGLDRDICPGTTTLIGNSAQPSTTYTWTPSTNLSNANTANPTVLATLSAPTTYSLTITKSFVEQSASFTCSSVPDDVNVTLKPQPATPTLSASAAEICQGATLTLTPANTTGVSQIIWFRNGTQLTTTSNTTYSPLTTSNGAANFTIQSKGVNGCLSLVSSPVSVMTYNAPTPVVTASVGTDVSNVVKLCPGITSTTLTATVTGATAAYQWYDTNNPGTILGTTNTLVVSGVTTVNKLRSVKATYTYGALQCVKTSAYKAIRQDATATGCRFMNDNEEVNDEMVVYPNPTSNVLNVKVQAVEAGESTLSLVNSLGQEVWSENRSFEQGTTEIQLSLGHLSAGIYHLILNKGDMHQTVKVIKE